MMPSSVSLTFVYLLFDTTPSLESVEGTYSSSSIFFSIISCAHLRAIRCPVLKSITGHLAIYANSELEVVSLESLETISSYLTVYR